MQEITSAQLETISGGDGTWSTIKSGAGTVARGAGKLFKVTAPFFAANDARVAWNDSRAAGDNRVVAGAKAAGAAVESVTWPLIPAVRAVGSALGPTPAY